MTFIIADAASQDPNPGEVLGGLICFAITAALVYFFIKKRKQNASAKAAPAAPAASRPASTRQVSFSSHGNTRVAAFHSKFFDATGVRVRAYVGFSNNPAADDRTIASIRNDSAEPEGSVTLRSDMTVGKGEKAVQKAFGFKVQFISASGDLLDNDLQLASVSRKL